jgi:hypothetical protein
MIKQKKALGKGLIIEVNFTLYYINKLKTLLSVSASKITLLVSIIFNRGFKHA